MVTHSQCLWFNHRLWVFSGLISNSNQNRNSELNELHKADSDSENTSVCLSQMEQVLRYQRENLTLSPSHSSVWGHNERLQIGFVVWLCRGSQQEKVMNKTSQRLSPQDWHTLTDTRASIRSRWRQILLVLIWGLLWQLLLLFYSRQ